VAPKMVQKAIFSFFFTIFGPIYDNSTLEVKKWTHVVSGTSAMLLSNEKRLATGLPALSARGKWQFFDKKMQMCSFY
jgi:hypothetical protein